MRSIGTVRLQSALFSIAGLAFVAAVSPLPTLAGGRRSTRPLAERLLWGPGIVNHPVGIRPSERVRVPQDWPLGEVGELTCLTCHTKLPSMSEHGDAHLRGSAGGSTDIVGFCSNCHDAAGASGPSSAHWMAVGYAHLAPEGESRARRGAVLDAVSNNCLTCHDGVSAREAGHQSLRSGGGYLGDPGRNHPVGIPYVRRETDHRGSPLRHVTLLPEEVRLPDGRVSCVSCHNLYNVDRHRLSVPIEGSRLCLTCHDMD